jgi:hypothetical protein
VLKEKPHLRKCLTRCRHCQILFFTHPRNAGRNDLGCPFGCREVHRRNSAIKRSIEYYKSPEGKIKKQYLNARRTQQGTSENSPTESKEEELPPKVCETPLDEPTIKYLQTVTSLIEERAVGLDEILCMVHRILRQLIMGKRKKMVYRDKYHQGRSP